MKNKIYKMLVYIFYALSLFTSLFFLSGRVNGLILLTRFRFILLFISCFLIYISGLILVKKLNYSKKVLKINLVVYFIVYTIMIITLTLFDDVFGRNGLVIANWTKELLNNYIKYSFNIVPFKTINLFITGYLNGYISFRSFAINIFGNILVFMPYGIFIPMIFKSINKYYKFLIIITIIVITIELLQFITLSGSCDIDDLLLNVIGASITFLIYKIKFLRKIINKIFLFE